MNSPFTVIIPARYASSRLPAKPLLDIGGKPMLQHVFERAQQSAASKVIIATDHEQIYSVAEAFGAQVCMTKEAHVSGTDRLQEVIAKTAMADDEVIVNVQGDEPLIPPAVINQVAELLVDKHCQMATLYESLTELSQLFDPNVVKLVSNSNQEAMTFSRAAIPWNRDKFPNKADASVLSDYKRHIGIYAYRANLLNQFVHWPVSPMESIEKLEQLRVIENGIAIAVAKACNAIPAGVDTMDDLLKVREIINSPSQ